jgi:hypothetical protein
MTRGMGIMEIFCQNKSFSKVLVVWGARMLVLVVWEAIQKTNDSLGG